MIGCPKEFKKTQTQCMFFEIKDEKLQAKDESIWNGTSKITGKRFGKQPVYCIEYLRTRLKSYHSQIKTDFHSKLPKKKTFTVFFWQQ